MWYDLTLAPPLGLALSDSQYKDGRVVVDYVREGGSVAEHNARHTVSDAVTLVPHFVQAGDELLMVNGTRCSSTEEAVELITEAAQEHGEVSLKFSRDTPGYVTVIFPEDGTSATLPGGSQVSEAAAQANHAVEYKCTDGTCGSCWHKDYDSGEVYLLCIDDIKVGLLPSKSTYKNDDIFWSETAWKNRKFNKPNFDNTEPLLLKSCPEDYQQWREANPIAAATSDATISRFGGALKGLAGGDTENPPESKSVKWGANKNWSGFE